MPTVHAALVAREGWRIGRVVLELAVFTGCPGHVCVRTYGTVLVRAFCRCLNNTIVRPICFAGVNEAGLGDTTGHRLYLSRQTDLAYLYFALSMTAFLRGAHFTCIGKSNVIMHQCC